VIQTDSAAELNHSHTELPIGHGFGVSIGSCESEIRFAVPEGMRLLQHDLLLVNSNIKPPLNQNEG
jgi:hypothetical protein